MSCLTLQPRFLNAQPLWWSRHIDFHTSCLICSFVKPILGMSQLICSFAISSFAELQNYTLFLGWPLSKMQNCSAVLFFSSSELQNIALFLGCPWSDMQSCGAILFLAFSELQNCAIFLAAPSPNCRTLVSLGRSTPAAGLRPPNHVLGAWL